MRKKSATLVCRLSMSLTTKTLEHVVLAYNLPRERAVVDRGKVAEAPQETAEAEAPHAALAAQPSTEAASEALPAHSFLIDSEAVVTGDDGLAVFDLIRRQQHGGAAVLCAFDLIELDGADLRRVHRAPQAKASAACSHPAPWHRAQ
jgi:hypothetical protein